MLSKLFAVILLATAASAHMKITSPIPYGASSLNNSPLFGNASDFPCKQRDGVYDLEGASNVYAQGSTQKLAFLGSTVHGGGSCQVSVTTDAQPDKNSVWKVIKSIEGGCPAKGQIGNMGEDASAIDPFTYDFTIPKELESGNYTLAWTWFNKVGGVREMYMNCAPVTVTGSGGSKDFMNTLPDMFVANIDGHGCATPDDKDVLFPDPGNDVDKFNGATEAFAPAICTGTSTGVASAAPTNGGSGSAPTGSPAQPTQASVPGGVFITKPPASQPAATQPAVSKPVASQPAASQPAVSQPVVTSAPVASPPAATSAAAPPPAPSSGSNASSGSSPSGGFAAGTACSSEGQWNCIGGTHFQRCASGSWSAPQAVAGGTSCQSGQAENLKMVAKRGMKSMRHAVRMRA